ncbi:MAG: hypothetical protein JW787_00200 [Sedimentisphaerales bacterium]|nr:hypothetical protein [Sedimentisphaerales bacterium]
MKNTSERVMSLFSDRKNDKVWTNVPLLALIAVNTIPLFGVIFFKWSIFYIVFLYWAENLAIGFYNVLKMLFVKVKHPAENLGKLFMIPFFMVHYGGFAAGHGFFIFHLFGKEHMVRFIHHRETWPCVFALLQKLINFLGDIMQTVPPGVRLAILSLFVSHGISFVYNFLMKGENSRTNLPILMFQPYVRVFVMHITVLIGGILLQVTGSPAALLLILVVLKTAIDVKLHNLEHKKSV